MNHIVVATLVALCGVVSFSDAFFVTNCRNTGVAVPVRFPGVAPAVTPRTNGYAWALRMSEEGQESKETKAPEGDYYDDEVEPAVKQDPLSNSMRAKLIAEASTGLDSDKKQTNVILYIMVVVAALVVLGGGGILY